MGEVKYNNPKMQSVIPNVSTASYRVRKISSSPEESEFLYVSGLHMFSGRQKNTKFRIAALFAFDKADRQPLLLSTLGGNVCKNIVSI